MSLLRFYQATTVITLSVYAYYLYYRLIYTINPDAIVISILFFYAELHGFIALFFYFFQMWHPLERKAPPPLNDRTVDVFITTYNEDPRLVRNTAIRCLKIEYPHKTYILDDGDRPEIKKIAEEIGCEYISRTDRRDYKAGNLNNALALTKGEFIAVFDSDYVPQPDFLEKAIGYFDDPKVAFVQTPQQYYNIDSFTFKVDLSKKKSWHEQDVFYRLMMAGRDYWNSAFFVGTSAVFRRRALEEIGGFSTGTITEDLHTTLKLYSRKWKGIYHNEILSAGLAPQDTKNYYIQKMRWAEGNVSLLFKEPSIFFKGLSIPQMICFFSTIFSWTIGFPKIIYFTMPSIMILTEQYPIANFDAAFLWRYGVFLTTVILGFKIVSRGYGHVRNDEIYNMMNFFVFIRAVLRSIFKSIFKGKSKFIVSEKGKGDETDIFHIFPQLGITLLCYAGLIWGILKLLYGISDDLIGIGIGILWSSINGILAFSTLNLLVSTLHRRCQFRFVDKLPVIYKVDRREGFGISKDINEYGTFLITFEELQIGQEASLFIHIGENVIKCKGEVVYIDIIPQGPGQVFGYGIRFKDLSETDRDSIMDFCFSSSIPKLFRIFERKESFFMRILFRWSNRRRLKRRSKRVERIAPIILRLNNSYNPLYSAIEDISQSGFSMRLYKHVEPNTEISVKIITSIGELSAKGVIKRVDKQRGGSNFVGVNFTEFGPGSKEILHRLIGG